MGNEIHLYKERVHFEDVDAASIVYHPVYLSYLERARLQLLLDKGASLRKIIEAELAFVIASMEIKYVRPLMLEDEFFVATQVDRREKSIIHMTQVIAFKAADLKRTNLKEELRQIESLQFFAHMKLCLISQKTKSLTAAPPWLVEIFGE